MRLKAFTLLELLVGMIATGIVIAAVFSAYHIIGRQTLLYRESSESVSELSLLHSCLLLDCDNSEQIRLLNARTIVFRTPTSVPDNVNAADSAVQLVYEFRNEYVLRSCDGHADTFFVAVASISAFTNGVAQIDGDGTVDELHFAFNDMETEIRLQKSDDVSVEMQEEFNHISE